MDGKTRVSGILISIFGFVFLFICSTISMSDVLQPVEFDNGWNAISIPCGISSAEFQQKLGARDVMVFGWNDIEYYEVDSMERGFGYILVANAGFNSSNICSTSTDGEPIHFDLHAGWNLVGNPYHTAASFNEIFKGYKFEIISIYEYRDSRFVRLSMNDNMMPWRGYWIYGHPGFSCISDASCEDGDSLTIDTCINPSTAEALCLNTTCIPACSSDSECYDSDVLTTGICKNPGTCDATCLSANDCEQTADISQNGQVNIFDWKFINANFAKTGDFSCMQGNVYKDDWVDMVDVVVFKKYYLNTVPSGGVPEIPTSTSSAVLSLSSFQDSLTKGQVIEINIVLDASGSSINGMDVFLNFPNDVLAVTDITQVIASPYNEKNSFAALVEEFDNETGTIAFNLISTDQLEPDFNESVAIITMSVLQTATASITFSRSGADNRYTAVIDNSEHKDITTTGITLGPGQ